MAEKIIGSIKGAEASAKAMIENQKKVNLEELEKSRLEAKECIKSANEALRESVKEANDRADKDALAEIESLKKDYESKISGLKMTAEKKLAEAVSFIIGHI